MRGVHLIVPYLSVVFAVGSLTCNARGDELLARTDAFEVAFGMSFPMYDWCGDALAGEMARKALIDKFDRCPFTPQARDHFRERASILRTQAAVEFNKLLAKNGGLLDRLPWMSKSCRETFAMPQYLERRAQLERYARGEIGSDNIFPDRCDVSSGAP